MLIRSTRPSDVCSSEITPKDLYLNRRMFLRTALAAGVGASFGTVALPRSAAARQTAPEFATMAPSTFSTEEAQTPWDSVTQYNNFYEFGLGKTDPAANAGAMETRPWALAIDGQVAKPGTFDVDDIIRESQLEERIYRLRCVETWSMVVPWVGIPLASVINRVGPTGAAKFLAFQTLYDPKQMPGQRRGLLDWPYVEGLRADEAMNPLAILAVGLYGERLPNQNGAPIRLVVPWKYGFKSIKSIVRISFVEQMPPTSWSRSAPAEYGFYANVNPNVDHPRWSQKRERRIGEFFKRETLMFNGYGDEVAHLYSGMDLRRWY